MSEKTKSDASERMVKLTASQIIDLLTERYLAQLGWNPETKKFDRKPIICRPIVMVGPAGIGKSEVPAQAAANVARIIQEAVMTRDCNLQYLESPDLAGLAENLMIEGERVTVHGRPGLLPAKGRGFWFLDEPNRVNRDIRSAMLTLIQARRVNDYTLGKDWMIVMAMNPSEHAGVSYEVGEWDRALRDRVTFVWFKPSLPELLTYLRKSYGDHIVLRWVESKGSTAETNEVVTFTAEENKITPRGLEFLIRAIDAAGGVSSPTWFRAAEAEIGTDMAVVLHKYIESSRTITAEEVLDSFGEPVIEKLTSFEEEGRHDVLNSVTQSVVMLLRQRFLEGMLLNSPEAQGMLTNLRSYLEHSNAEQKAKFFLLGGEQLQTLPNRMILREICEFMTHSPALMDHFAKVRAAKEEAERAMKK